MRYQLYGVIHVYVVPGNEERKRPEVLFPTAVQIMSRRRFPHHIHLRLAQEGPKKPRGYFGKSHLNPLACSKRTQATPGCPFSNTQWSSVFSIHSYLHGAREEPKEASRCPFSDAMCDVPQIRQCQVSVFVVHRNSLAISTKPEG